MTQRKTSPKQTTGMKTSKAGGGDYAVVLDENDQPVSTVRTDGTDLEYQIAHGKAPMQPGPEQPVDPADAAAAKLNRGLGKGG